MSLNEATDMQPKEKNAANEEEKLEAKYKLRRSIN
jgi:hypothetical protein